MIYQNKNFYWRRISQSEIRNSAVAEKRTLEEKLSDPALYICQNTQSTSE